MILVPKLQFRIKDVAILVYYSHLELIICVNDDQS